MTLLLRKYLVNRLSYDWPQRIDVWTTTSERKVSLFWIWKREDSLPPCAPLSLRVILRAWIGRLIGRDQWLVHVSWVPAQRVRKMWEGIGKDLLPNWIGACREVGVVRNVDPARWINCRRFFSLALSSSLARRKRRRRVWKRLSRHIPAGAWDLRGWGWAAVGLIRRPWLIFFFFGWLKRIYFNHLSRRLPANSRKFFWLITIKQVLFFLITIKSLPAVASVNKKTPLFHINSSVKSSESTMAQRDSFLRDQVTCPVWGFELVRTQINPYNFLLSVSKYTSFCLWCRSKTVLQFFFLSWGDTIWEHGAFGPLRSFE